MHGARWWGVRGTRAALALRNVWSDQEKVGQNRANRSGKRWTLLLTIPLHFAQGRPFVSLAFFGTRVGKAVTNSTNCLHAIREFAEFATKCGDVHVDCA
ncbi:MAG: hypothetical protein RIR10_1328 [Planctomycetota bacterium]